MRVGIIGAGFMGSLMRRPGPRRRPVSWALCRAPRPKQGLVGRAVQARVYPDSASYSGDVDVVDICTPTHLHYEMALAAAAAGKHVVCEKPLARTLAQGQAMVAACRRAGVRLLVAHVVRFFPEYALAQALVAAGRSGGPACCGCRGAASGPRSRRATGSSMSRSRAACSSI